MELAIPDRRSIIQAHRAAGGKLAAVFPYHAPRALLRAHGFLPVEVWGPPGRQTGSGDAHLQPYTCSLVRAGLAFLQDGGLAEAEAILVPHGCDSLQGLGSLLLDFARPRAPVLTCYLPRGERAVDHAFLRDELRELADRLAEIAARAPSSADLLQAIEREERADALLGELLARRVELDLSEVAFYRLVRSREYLPPERFEALAREALARPRSPARERTRILLSGLVPEPMAILDALEEARATVAADDLACSGRRRYQPTHGDDPWTRLAAGLLSGPPDSTRGAGVGARLEHLLRLAEASRARGVVFLTLKFCEPELFYLPQLRTGLERKGLRCLNLEVDLAEGLPAPVVTRLEAFLETLQ